MRKVFRMILVCSGLFVCEFSAYVPVASNRQYSERLICQVLDSLKYMQVVVFVALPKHSKYLMSFRTLRQIFRRIMRSFPVVRAANYLEAQIDKTNPYFVGWGMTTRVYPPWHEGKGDSVSRSFYETNA